MSDFGCRVCGRQAAGSRTSPERPATTGAPVADTPAPHPPDIRNPTSDIPSEGDLVLLPHGRGHFLGDRPHSPTVRIDAMRHRKIGQGASVLRHGGKGKRAMIICGGVKFEEPAYHPLLESMPEALLIRGQAGRSEKWVQNTIEMMALEAKTPRPGTPTVITHLTDILVIQAVRAWLEQSTADTGWVSAVRDPHVGRAIALIHRKPERRWSVGALASEAHLSRSVFAERFTKLAAMSPMQYVTRWRMRLANLWLREDRMALSEIAGRIGYGSEAAFSRAYKREIGVPPGAARRGQAISLPHSAHASGQGSQR